MNNKAATTTPATTLNNKAGRSDSAAVSASSAPGRPQPHHPATNLRLALLGNPNTGKTTLFNRLCGLRAKTANFPGSTVDARVGRCTLHVASQHDPTATEPQPIELIDLPGLYRLGLNLPESKLCRDVLDGTDTTGPVPDAAIVVADASNLARNLCLVAELLARGFPVILALNMIDIARRRGLSIDTDALGRKLGCRVVPVAARQGIGLDELRAAMARMVDRCIRNMPADHVTVSDAAVLPDVSDTSAIAEWADEIVRTSVGGPAAVGEASDSIIDRLDAAFTHPIVGVLVFAAVMTGLFWTIFSLAQLPMSLIEISFEYLGGFLGTVLPPGMVHDLLVDGVIGGVAGTVVFLPQICLLFFLISLLEDTGYLARAAFVMDRLMCRFGLPGQAFVPMLSSHACAIPGIMSAKLIPDPQDRLATILVSPFMSCSARLPVYVLLIGLLFRDNAALGGLAFFGCYGLGALAAFGTAFVARRSILRGKSRPMVLELPTYKWPSLLSALLTTWDQGIDFLKKAGTIIVALCIVLWWLSAYPKVDPPQPALDMLAQAQLVESADAAEAEQLRTEAAAITARHEQASSFAGRMGRVVQPVFEPLGYDWQLTVGVVASFAAREVFVSTMAVLTSGSDDVEDEGILNQIYQAQRDDGSPVITKSTAASLLVFYVLAMQCLPTLAVTRRETGSWKWAALQFGYMSSLAWVASLVTYQGLRWMGVP
ncbi:MAG: ferrous iron transporter B [Planctomycetes bacterium]|nr:ferrous iron transporter B [Planctomycetota bacterium]NOG53403.1 ferrous iron transporter B [Planctomycetota bacterium]